MSNKIVFVIRNQDDRYLTKKQQWVSGQDNSIVYRNVERDVVLNELIEVNAKDILARLELVEVELNSHKHPVVEVLADDPPEALDENEAEEGLGEFESNQPNLELVKPSESSVQQDSATS